MANWSIADCCFPFLEETYKRVDFWLTGCANADGASGSNRMYFVENAWRRCVSLAQRCRSDGHGPRKDFNLHFFWGIVGAGQ